MGMNGGWLQKLMTVSTEVLGVLVERKPTKFVSGIKSKSDNWILCIPEMLTAGTDIFSLVYTSIMICKNSCMIQTTHSITAFLAASTIIRTEGI